MKLITRTHDEINEDHITSVSEEHDIVIWMFSLCIMDFLKKENLLPASLGNSSKVGILWKHSIVLIFCVNNMKFMKNILLMSVIVCE